MINFWIFLIFISVTGLTYGLLSLREISSGQIADRPD
jgi:hypothetical protein